MALITHKDIEQARTIRAFLFSAGFDIIAVIHEYDSIKQVIENVLSNETYISDGPIRTEYKRAAWLYLPK